MLDSQNTIPEAGKAALNSISQRIRLTRDIWVWLEAQAISQSIRFYGLLVLRDC